MNLKNVYLITERISVIDFFKDFMGLSVKSTFIDSVFTNELYISNFVVMDASVLDTDKIETLPKKADKKYPILCLISNGINIEVREYAEEQFQFVLPFPIHKDLVKECFRQIEILSGELALIKNRIYMKNLLCKSMNNDKDTNHDNQGETKSFVSLTDSNNSKSCHGNSCSIVVCKDNESNYRQIIDNNRSIISDSNKNHRLGEDDYSLSNCFLGYSDAIKDIRKKLHKVAALESPVLLLGETGSGKSTGAKIIHSLSKRSSERMFSLNMAEIVESLASSIFFGTVSGAYTDAKNKNGMFKLADKSTLFLDEIGATSVSIQSTLLTVIETGQFRKMGSDIPEKSNARLLFATNSDLEVMLNNKTFRYDFFSRICANIITFPPIRDRIEDIPEITKAYLKRYKKDISEDGLCKLIGYSWPGNIRELNQCLSRAISNSSEDVIQADDIDYRLFKS